MTEVTVYMTEKGFVLEFGHSVSWEMAVFRFRRIVPFLC